MYSLAELLVPCLHLGWRLGYLRWYWNSNLFGHFWCTYKNSLCSTCLKTKYFWILYWLGIRLTTQPIAVSVCRRHSQFNGILLPTLAWLSRGIKIKVFWSCPSSSRFFLQNFFSLEKYEENLFEERIWLATILWLSGPRREDLSGLLKNYDKVNISFCSNKRLKNELMWQNSPFALALRNKVSNQSLYQELKRVFSMKYLMKE